MSVQTAQAVFFLAIRYVVSLNDWWYPHVRRFLVRLRVSVPTIPAYAGHDMGNQ